jgi:hypothetical protein
MINFLDFIRHQNLLSDGVSEAGLCLRPQVEKLLRWPNRWAATVCPEIEVTQETIYKPNTTETVCGN